MVQAAAAGCCCLTTFSASGSREDEHCPILSLLPSLNVSVLIFLAWRVVQVQLSVYINKFNARATSTFLLIWFVLKTLRDLIFGKRILKSAPDFSF
jgi:hypothetical protein